MKGVLSLEQRQQLSRHFARRLLRAIQRTDLEPHLHEVAPLADLCLLAWRREQLWNDDTAARDPVARLHTSTSLTRDFLARLDAW
jgi:GAF domain-containing protein